MHLSILFLIPFAGLLTIPLISNNRVKNVSLAYSLVAFLYSVYLALILDYSDTFQFVESYHLFNTHFVVGCDGISMVFILLTAFIMPICILVSRESIKSNLKAFYICLLSIELLLFGVFSVLDLLGFYVVYEAILIPMVLIIGV
jgi:NADH-quinone oxidoreductase subunit M